MTEQQKRNLIIGAVGVGAFLAAQALRRRSDYDFAGKSVVITGGSRGLGLVMARELAHQGARLTLVARSDERRRRVAKNSTLDVLRRRVVKHDWIQSPAKPAPRSGRAVRRAVISARNIARMLPRRSGCS